MKSKPGLRSRNASAGRLSPPCPPALVRRAGEWLQPVEAGGGEGARTRRNLSEDGIRSGAILRQMRRSSPSRCLPMWFNDSTALWNRQDRAALLHEGDRPLGLGCSESFIASDRERPAELDHAVEDDLGVAVSGLEADGGDRFYCGGSNGKVRAVRRPR
jgi:hypothetical protein